jgi:hypothetical protein
MVNVPRRRSHRCNILVLRPGSASWSGEDDEIGEYTIVEGHTPTMSRYIPFSPPGFETDAPRLKSVQSCCYFQESSTTSSSLAPAIARARCSSIWTVHDQFYTSTKHRRNLTLLITIGHHRIRSCWLSLVVIVELVSHKLSGRWYNCRGMLSCNIQ